MELFLLMMLIGLGYAITKLGKAAVANPQASLGAGKAIWGLFK